MHSTSHRASSRHWRLALVVLLLVVAPSLPAPSERLLTRDDELARLAGGDIGLERTDSYAQQFAPQVGGPWLPQNF